ncbi:AEC family transporter [Thermopolyspora sp. NPDC052614]|uniref:AEC family transporter n=1 Tax=Thermopolyspora sp. NPDC052614 TaxID=3155682 RepID=UPI00344A6CC6
MTEVVAAFAALVSVAVLGYVIGLSGVLRPQDEGVLSRLAFFVAAPALLFTTISTADLSSILSPVLVTAVVGVLVVQTVYVLTAKVLWRRPRSEVALGALASSYVNSGNLGIPISVYVLGDGALVAPILLLQLLVIVPAAFLVLDAGPEGQGPGSAWGVLWRALRNPITVSSLLGLAVALTGLDIPDPIMEPIGIVGAAAVPVGLLAYGLGLSGGGRRRGRSDRSDRGDRGEAGGEAADPPEAATRRDIVLAVLLKSFAQPAVTHLAGLLLGLQGTMLLAATLFGALPTAQNIYIFAVRYRSAMRMVRTTLMVTTGLSIPVMVVISGLLR